MNLYQLAQEMGKIHGSSGISQFYYFLAGQRFKCNEQVDHAAAAIFIILPLWISGLWRNASLLNKLPVRLIQADHRAQRIIRTLIYIQNVLNPRYKLRPGLWNAPFLLSPGLKFVFSVFPLPLCLKCCPQRQAVPVHPLSAARSTAPVPPALVNRQWL